jgi:Neprosin
MTVSRTLPRAVAALSVVVAVTIAAPGGPASAGQAGVNQARPMTTQPIDTGERPGRHGQVHRPWAHGSERAGAYNYFYAEAKQDFAPGAFRTNLAATFTVHHPAQVVNNSKRADHSLGEMAVRAPNLKFTYVEAGWLQSGTKTKPQLFVFWWSNGNAHCYNFGCGFVRAGTGIRPGSTLSPGTHIRLSWSHHDQKWWLSVNGKTSGYYPDKLWDGKFTRAEGVQIFGEVAIRKGHPGCDDMGNGRWPSSPKAAKVFDVTYGSGTVALSKGNVTAPNRYDLILTGNGSFRYGGPGDC